MGQQCRRVLRALRRHPDGVTQVDFLLPNIIDGGHPITRLAARIKDLRDDGHEIGVDGERYGCAVYKLASVEVPAASVSADIGTLPVPDVGGDLDATPALFELPHKPSSPYDEAA